MIRLGWNAIYEQFFIADDDGATNLPSVSAALLDDVDRWQDYLRENFEPHDDITGGRWQGCLGEGALKAVRDSPSECVGS